MRRIILIASSFLRCVFAATLLVAPVASGATLAPAAVALAQTADESQAALPICPAWYGAHTACIPGTAGVAAESKPAFAPIEATPATTSSDNPDYGPAWTGPVTTAPPGICPAWYGSHTACVPAISGADER